MSPQVSVVIPTYNAAAFVRRAVDSVLLQTLCEVELLVVDDSSHDDTLTVLAGYGDRIQVFTQANAGPAAARNHGLRLAGGEFVAFLDADDHWLPSKLERQVVLLRARPELGFCSTATTIVDAAGSKLGDWPCCSVNEPMLDLLFVQGAAVSGSTSGVLARRSLLEAVGGFDERLRGFEDPDLWMRLAARSGYACIAEALTVVTRTSGSVSSHLPRMRAATLASLRKNRTLLPAARRGGFWRRACASALTDYAKMAWRNGDRWHALAWATEALLRSPLGRGRLAASLLVAMLRGARI